MNYQKRAMLVLCAALVAAVLPALLLVVYVDPFRVYHPPFVAGMGLQENQRYQNAGLINSYLADPAQGYDSVLIGTSMSQNFTGAMVAQTLGWKKSLRLFMPGAMAEEQIAVLRHALDTGRVQHVLLELHPFLYQDSYRQKKQIAAEPSLYFPAFLYNDRLLDDAAYLFNMDVLAMSWRALLQAPSSKVLTPETIGYWADDDTVGSEHLRFNASDNLAQLRQQTAGFSVTAKSDSEIEALDFPILTDALYPVLNRYCNGDVEIVMFVPPWPRFRYQKSEKVTLRSVYMMRHILRVIERCPNISLYNFDLLDFTGDINNYKDEQHYLPAINGELLKRIAEKQNRLTLADAKTFENRFIEHLNNYSAYSSYQQHLQGD